MTVQLRLDYASPDTEHRRLRRARGHDGSGMGKRREQQKTAMQQQA
jgi:hypothetical protein